VYSNLALHLRRLLDIDRIIPIEHRVDAGGQGTPQDRARQPIIDRLKDRYAGFEPLRRTGVPACREVNQGIAVARPGASAPEMDQPEGGDRNGIVPDP
jgi:hypothetical protein